MRLNSCKRVSGKTIHRKRLRKNRQNSETDKEKDTYYNLQTKNNDRYMLMKKNE